MPMQKNIWIAIAISLGLMFGIAGEAMAACPTGKITCASWCAKYRPGAQDCFVGPNSCETKPGGRASCVGDICNAQNDSCKRLQDIEIKKKGGH